jgi:flagellar hook-associated protein 1 FlgK
MADLLSTGVSALLAFQRELNVTGHNIANANTPGYSRQRAELATKRPSLNGNGYVGNGVRVDTVRRLYNSFLAARVRSTGSDKSRLDQFHALAAGLDNLLASSDAGLAPALQKFFGAVGDVANDPASIPARQSLLSRAGALTDRFHYLEGQVDSLEGQVHDRVKTTVGSINSLAKSIAALNRRIVGARGRAGGQPPNDLLDKRGVLVGKLAKQIGVKTVVQDNGSLNVSVGHGQPLVVGANARELTAVKNAYDPARLDVALVGGSVNTVITRQLSGGALGGALDARREVLEPARAALGRAAIGLARSVNAQHRLGMDLNGRLGGDFFTVAGPDVLANAANSGGATVNARIGDVGKLSNHNYLLKYDGGNWTLTNADTGEAVSMTGSGTAADPFVAAGLQVVVDGDAAPGDRFLIRPTADAADSLSVALDDPNEVAAAAPIRTAAGADNAGDAAISAGKAVDASNPDLLQSVTIQFTSSTTYTINGGPAQTFTSGEPIQHNGWQVAISGTPAAGDTFTVESNAGGVGDNRNALALGKLQNSGVLDNGNTSIGDAYARLVANVGTQTRQAKANLDAQTALATQAKAAEQSVSGVNLDEEAANLVRFQQAYQAAAKTITTAQTVFESLLRAV